MRVLFVTPEMSDYVQTGGLAAVAAALPRALRALGDVRVILPGYPAVLKRLESAEAVGHCPPEGQLPPAQMLRGETADGLPVYVVRCAPLFERDGGPYCDGCGRDWADNDMRFARFASAAAALAAGKVDPDWSADLVHANDWQAGLVPAYIKWHGWNVPSLLTVHNLAYQGNFPPCTLGRINAPDGAFQIEGVEFHGKVSFLKAGLQYASHLTTVSETYAREITTAEHGCGLEGLLQRRAGKSELTGILNGIDESWDPRVCPDLVRPFAPGGWEERQENADHLRREFGLAIRRGPLFGLIARLVHQKGVDLVLSAADAIVQAGGQIIVMGRGDPVFEQELTEAQHQRPDAFAAALRFSPGEERRILAGSDFCMMPSRFEPCGLTQMYAQRFGALPIGRRTGGLADTIHDGETGFLFPHASAASFLGGIVRAFATYGSKQRLNRMREQAMGRSFSWSESASDYGRLYRSLLGSAVA
ncbi:MAG: glycogen synthase GlgA [Alphaproteobacteria bacterium]|nr:glycogen synthase GlgA [Alphaproteobacteria bacterium]